MGNSRIPFRAQYQPHRRVLARVGPMLARVFQIQVQPAGAGVRELAEFQIHDRKVPKAAVEENQINPGPRPSIWGPTTSSLSLSTRGNWRVP